jgi:tRNA-dihydrouridine synthase
MESTTKIDISDEKPTEKIDRRISVAPMMDWTDELYSAFCISNLDCLENACHLYGTSISGHLGSGASIVLHDHSRR